MGGQVYHSLKNQIDEKILQVKNNQKHSQIKDTTSTTQITSVIDQYVSGSAHQPELTTNRNECMQSSSSAGASTTLSWNSFCKLYDNLVISLLSRTTHVISSPKQSPEFSMEYNSTNKGTVKSSWNSHNGTAGGGIHERSWRNSPLFRVSMSTFVQCKGYLRITISLPDERQDAAK